MTISVSSSNSPNPKIIPETSKDLPRKSTSTPWKFRVSMDQETTKLPELSEKTTRKKKMKGKKDSFTPMLRLVSPVKKMTCAIFSRKKAVAGENRDHQGDETLAVGTVKPKKYPLQKKVSFWKSARIRLMLGQRMKTRRRKGMGEEEELCKKRILMGERCKPMNKSGVLHYDGDGILLPDP